MTVGASTNDVPTAGRRPLFGLLGATGFSVSGNAMVAVLIPWLVLERTGSAAYAGLVGSIAAAAGVVALFGGGALIDRLDRRTLSIAADLLSAVSVAALPILDAFFGLTVAVIVGLVAIGALFDGPGRAAREALRPAVAKITPASLERVNGFGEVADGMGALLGPALAGILVGATSLGAALWFATSAFVTAALLQTVGGLGDEAGTPPERPMETSYWHESVEGVRIVWHDQVLRSTAIMLSLFGFFLAPLVLALTVQFEQTNRSAALGVVISSFSLGAIGSSLAYAALADRLPRRTTLLLSLALASAGVAAMAAAIGSLGALIGISIATGLAAGPIGPILSVLMQDRAADQHRGRVLATMGSLELIAAPLAIALTGVLIEATSARLALFIGGIGCLAATTYGAITPGLRHIEREDLVHAG